MGRLLMLTKMLLRPTTKCTLCIECEWSGGLWFEKEVETIDEKG
jgi:hypothetical protein